MALSCPWALGLETDGRMKIRLILFFEVEVHLPGRNAPAAITIAQFPAAQPEEPPDDQAELDDQADHGVRPVVSFGNGESTPP